LVVSKEVAASNWTAVVREARKAWVMGSEGGKESR